MRSLQVAAVAALSAAAPASAPALRTGATAQPRAHTAGCAGRVLLQCGEKLSLYADLVNSSRAYVLEAELFEAPQVHVYNRTLAQFWRFEASAAAARVGYETVIGNEFADTNFEAIARRAVLPNPVLSASGKVDRGMARTLTNLIKAEQNEVLNLAAMAVSLDRATAASYLRGRADWTKWQQSTAAGFARRAAGAAAWAITLQRRVTAALLRKHLPFGVGSVDLKLAQRAVRRNGFVPSLVGAMRRLGLTNDSIASFASQFAKADIGQSSYNVSEALSQSDVISGERKLASTLRLFAARIPPASKPPS